MTSREILIRRKNFNIVADEGSICYETFGDYGEIVPICEDVEGNWDEKLNIIEAFLNEIGETLYEE